MPLKIKFFKSFCKFVFYLLIFIVFSKSYAFPLKGDKTPLYPEKGEKQKIKAGINFREGVVESDFYVNSDLNKYKGLGNSQLLAGIWFGYFKLLPSNVFWINPDLERGKILNRIEFGPYSVYLKLDADNDGRKADLYIGQNDIEYSSVNIERVNDKQINYWAKAVTKNWDEAIRGKIFRTDESKLFTQFQTAVYEDKIPIYAFRGEVSLKKY